MKVTEAKSESDSKIDPAFPRLDASEIAAAAAIGNTMRVAAGSTLFKTGDIPLDCYHRDDWRHRHLRHHQLD